MLEPDIQEKVAAKDSTLTGGSSPRSALTLATRSRYSSPDFKEPQESTVDGTAKHRNVGGNEEEQEEDEEEANNAHRKQEDSKNKVVPDDTPSWMLMEDIFNSVQVTRKTLRNINKKAPSEEASNVERDETPRDVDFLASMKADAEAMAAEDEFFKTLSRWESEMDIEERSPTERQRFAHYLSDIFLCSRLDALTSTASVVSIRKRVVREIEKVEGISQWANREDMEDGEIGVVQENGGNKEGGGGGGGGGGGVAEEGKDE